MKRNLSLRIRKTGLSRPKFGQKAGLAPGTLAYTGESRQFEPWIDLIRFNETMFEEKHRIGIPELKNERFDSNHVVWINVTGIHKTELIQQIGQDYGLHGLVMEDIVHPNQRPKLDEYDDYLYVVGKMIQFNPETQEISNEQLSVVLRGNTLITFIEDKGDLFEQVRDRIRKGNQKIRKSGADYLVYSLLDSMVDNYFVVLESIGDHLEDLEIRLLEDPRTEVLQELHKAKRDLIYLRKFIWPLREVISLLSKGDSLLLTGNTTLYLRDVYDHCIHVIDTLETFRDVSSGLMDVYLSSISNKMNNVMKTLTIIATIFIPLTFLVGVYGMNFKFMPELNYKWAYPTVWGAMIVIAGGMLIWFRKNRWW
jgi:magnesium transporter